MEEEYPDLDLNIRVSVKHDEDSDNEEIVDLRKENEELKARLKDLGAGEGE